MFLILKPKWAYVLYLVLIYYYQEAIILGTLVSHVLGQRASTKDKQFLKVCRSESWNFGIILKYNSLSGPPLEELFLSISTYPLCPNRLGQLSSMRGLGAGTQGEGLKKTYAAEGEGLTDVLSRWGRGRVGEKSFRQPLRHFITGVTSFHETWKCRQLQATSQKDWHKTWNISHLYSFLPLMPSWKLSYLTSHDLYHPFETTPFPTLLPSPDIEVFHSVLVFAVLCSRLPTVGSTH